MVDYKEKAKNCRLKVLEMIWRAGTSHVASNFSIIDVATVLYENLRKGDEVVWSAGWKAATIYYFLAKQGKIPKEDLDIFGKEIDGKIKYLGLAETTTNGIWVNGGSMGHGLPIACGMALAKKLKGEAGNIYCIMSDGEMNEGTTWECAAFAAHHKLDNLIVIVDINSIQAMGYTEDILDLEPLQNRFSGFDWEYFRGDGHDFDFLHKVFNHSILDGPAVILCNTVKGWGGQTACNIFEKGLLYHYKHVDEETFREATKLLQKDEVRTLRD
jgi:transketolase